MYAEIEAGGLIYGVQMSLNASTKLGEWLDSQKGVETTNNHGEVKGVQARLVCTQIIREDAHLLFAFSDELEKQTFERLIKISGVGPKVALAILSSYTPQSFAQIIANKDIDALKKVPGIGAKNAGKIMVDVAGFFASFIETAQPHNAQKLNPLESVRNEAANALQTLGFKASEINRVLNSCESSDVSELIKQALKKLG